MISFLPSAYAQTTEPKPPEREPEIIQWNIAPEGIHKNIHFILDRSGSMSAEQLTSAMSCFLTVAGQATDEINIAITLFGQDTVRWPGCPDENTPPQWASLPSQENLEAARIWIATTPVNGNSTQVSDAISSVDNKPIARTGGAINEVTVIIISDLQFDSFPGSITAPLQKLREARQKNGCKDMSFGFVGIYATPDSLGRLRALCEEKGCWLAFITRPEEPEDEEPAPPTNQQQLPPPDPNTPDPLPLPFPH